MKKLFIFALAFLLPVLVLAQSDPKIGYTQFPGENQTRNLPAGTVQDPGSHLTYIVETGLNARSIAGKADLTDVAAAAKTPLAAGSLLQPFMDKNADGALDDGAIYKNYISISNTNPTMAVTVHFRYFNDNCEDLLDFLVVLTCNDTLLFDPLDFVIPQTDGENTKNRMIGPPGKVLQPISVKDWGSGRFLITAAASGATTDVDDDAEILFPKEFEALNGKCNIKTKDALNGTLNEILAAGNKIANVGQNKGFAIDNLHVFNASQISFNYLIGALTTAIPAVPGTDQISWGVPAWARPAVDRNFDLARSVISLQEDGDGPHVNALTGKILWGTERAYQSSGADAASNAYYLRNEVHGGDIWPAQVQDLTALGVTKAPSANYMRDRAAVVAKTHGGFSLYGALGTMPFYLISPDAENQRLHLVAVADDYNGSNNAALGFGGVLADRSANISPAITTYVLQIYDNNEDMLTFKTPPIVPVSPPQIQGTAVLKLSCVCLRVFLNFRDNSTATDEFNGSTSVDDLALVDLKFFGNEVFNGYGDFDGLLKSSTLDSKGSVDLSGGWIRLVRDNTVIGGDWDSKGTGKLAAPYNNFNDWDGIPDDTGMTVEGKFAAGPGTSTFNDPVYGDNASELADPGPSFLTIGLYVVKFQGFGASWYMPAVASDALVSEKGTEVVR